MQGANYFIKGIILYGLYVEYSRAQSVLCIRARRGPCLLCHLLLCEPGTNNIRLLLPELLPAVLDQSLDPSLPGRGQCIGTKGYTHHQSKRHERFPKGPGSTMKILDIIAWFFFFKAKNVNSLANVGIHYRALVSAA